MGKQVTLDYSKTGSFISAEEISWFPEGAQAMIFWVGSIFR